MFENSDSTFSIRQLIRVFTVCDIKSFTEETISFDNVCFVGDDLIIIYDNTI